SPERTLRRSPTPEIRAICACVNLGNIWSRRSAYISVMSSHARPARARSWRLAGCSPTLQTSRDVPSGGELRRPDPQGHETGRGQEPLYRAMEGETKDRPPRASLRQGSRSDASSDLRT